MCRIHLLLSCLFRAADALYIVTTVYIFETSRYFCTHDNTKGKKKRGIIARITFTSTIVMS